VTSRTVDVAAARAATPGCETGAFLLSAGASLPTQQTLDAVIAYLRHEAEIGGYEAADDVAPVLTQCRADLATLVGGTPDEIALAPSDSVAWVKAWFGWVLGGNVSPGSTVLVDRLIYHSHYAALVQTQAFAGFEIEVMPTLADGTVDIEQLRGADRVDDRIGAICTTMIGTHCGNVNPVESIGALARAAGVPMFVDACQALGQIVLDVEAIGCSVLTGTGRKFLRGPRGTGMLWIDDALIERFRPPGLDGDNTAWSARDGMQIRPGIGRFEEYEVSYAAMVGLGAAARQALDVGVDAIERSVTSLADDLRSKLAAIDRVTVRDTAARRSAIVTLDVDGVEPGDVVAVAARAGVRINESSATWAALDMDAKGLGRVIRASPHYFNTSDDLERLVEVVADVVADTTAG
jgi:cysteine desulfurase / selenocysteine lyase